MFVPLLVIFIGPLFLAVHHVWISGRLNMTKDVTSDAVSFVWYNPNNRRRIHDVKTGGNSGTLYVSI